MSKRFKGIIAILIILIITLVCVKVWSDEREENISMKGLPKGELINESTSPEGTYTVRTYLSDEGGATVGFAVRGEMIENKNKGKTKNIYWEYKINKSEIEWENENIVVINKQKIELPNGTYDWRVNKN